jgi:formamidopyrimidine-DNA glycosylase
LVEANKTKNITVFLTDQKMLSGIGNYLKSEILYYAKISPYKNLEDLSIHKIEKLYEAIKIVPRISYNYNGLSTSNRKGYFDSQLKVYKKSFSLKEKTPDKATTYWKPSEQE